MSDKAKHTNIAFKLKNCITKEARSDFVFSTGRSTNADYKRFHQNVLVAILVRA